jgi:hypothetical protein
MLTLHTPSRSLPYPSSINDSGVVVGSYDDDLSAPIVHGFIYHNGQWETLAAPNSLRFHFAGISLGIGDSP